MVQQVIPSGKNETVTAAYTKANLPELLKAVAAGESIMISRYNIPVADFIPSTKAVRPAPQFGTMKGKIEPLGPEYFAPMTDEEADEFVKGRY